MIHVCFCFHDKKGRYAKFVGTAMFSIFKNTNSEVTVHLLHDNTLTQENRDKFLELTDHYYHKVKFYNVAEICSEKLTEYLNLVPSIKTDERVGIGAFFRLLIPKVLPSDIEKCIYLDADIIVNLDINELGDKPLGVVPECFQSEDRENFIARSMENAIKVYADGFINAEDYFNSGVLLINLKVIGNEEDKIIEGLKFRNEHPEYGFYDQEVLNYSYASRALKLPVKFNRFVMSARFDKEYFLEKKIYHYAGNRDGFGLNMNDPFNKLWMDYFVKTPWFNASTIDNLYEYILKQSEDYLAQMKKFSATLSGKTRTFIVNWESLERIKKEFFVRDDEEIIVVAEDSLNQNLIDKIKSECEKKVFFGFVSGFPEVLKEEGLLEGEDFFNGFLFFPDVWRYFKLEDGYQIIKEM